jgi:hypothetical protein
MRSCQITLDDACCRFSDKLELQVGRLQHLQIDLNSQLAASVWTNDLTSEKKLETFEKMHHSTKEN